MHPFKKERYFYERLRVLRQFDHDGEKMIIMRFYVNHGSLTDGIEIAKVHNRPILKVILKMVSLQSRIHLNL